MYNIEDGKVKKANAPLLDVTKQEATNYGLLPGDILINRVNSIDQVGKAGIVPDDLGDATFESKNIRVRVSPDKCNSNYLAYFLNTSLYLKQIRSTIKPAVAQATINQDDLDQIQICMPALSEQQEITCILSTVDESIQKSDQIITKTQQLKTGLMQQLFTRGIGHSIFKQTEVGEIPEEWDIVILNDYAIVKGRIGWKGLKASEYTETGPYLIANKHLLNQKVVWDKCDHISSFRYEESQEIQLRTGDVILSKDGTIGKPAFLDSLPNKATINSTMMLLRVHDNNLDAQFLFYFLQTQSFKRFIFQKTSGSSIPHLFQGDMKQLKFALPPKEEQSKIISTLSSIDLRLEKEMLMKEALKNLKKGLMNDLLTGKVRVKVT
jgi:type I restriction enzyme S subunit